VSALWTVEQVDRNRLIREVAELLDRLRPTIDDGFRADPEDEEPGIQVTIATSDGESWVYQTGDNSFMGDCYGHRHWGVMSLYRDSDTHEVASDGVAMMLESYLEAV